MPKIKQKKTDDYPSVSQYLLKKRLKQYGVVEEGKNDSESAVYTRTNDSEQIACLQQFENVNEVNRIRELEQRLQISENNLKLAKKMIRKSNDINFEKDLKIKYLEGKSKQIESVNNLLFSEQSLSKNFDSNELKVIRSIGPGCKNDSTFILKIMRSLYKQNELKKLENRNPTGKEYKGIKKQEITLNKKEIMEQMLSERVSDELKGASSENFTEYLQRTAKLNLHIRHAIRNILTHHAKINSVKKWIYFQIQLKLTFFAFCFIATVNSSVTTNCKSTVNGSNRYTSKS